jgi:hypothetical protein
MSEKFLFMREFSGVPLVVTSDQRMSARRKLTASAAFLALRYAEAVEPVDSSLPDTASLFLYHQAAEELVQIAADITPAGYVQFPVVGISALGSRGIAEHHTYKIDDSSAVVREDVADFESERRAVDSEHEPYVQENLRADLEEGRPPVWPVNEATVDMSAFGALTNDAVLPDEIQGMHAYFEQKVDGGLYVPIGFDRAQELMGFYD